MISKPPGDWYNQDRTVQAARQFGDVASKALSAGTSGLIRARAVTRAIGCGVTAAVSVFAALGAGLLGRNIPMFVLAGGCSLLLGWLAVRNARVALGHTRSVPEKFSPMPDTAGFNSRQDPWGHQGEMARNTATGMQAGGSSIDYKRSKLLIRAVASLVACVIMAVVLMGSMRLNPIISLLVLAALGFYLWRFVSLLIRFAANDLTAIAWDNRQIRIRTLTSSRQVPWQSVESVKSTRTVRRIYGIIPISTSYDMVFQLRQNGSRRNMKILSGALAITPVAADQLVQLALRRAQLADQNPGTGDRPVFSSPRMAAQPDRGEKELDPVFAHDMAERPRAFGTSGQSAVAPGGFGRKVV